MKKITRREALKLGTLAGGSLLLPTAFLYRNQASTAATAGSPQPTRFIVKLPIPPVLKPVRSNATTDYYEMTMKKLGLIFCLG